MGHTFKIIRIIIVGISIFLYYETAAQAKNLLDIELRQNSQKLIESQAKTATDLNKFNFLNPGDKAEIQDNNKSIIAQSQVDGNSNLKNLNPSPNLLQLSKAPEAVKITIDRAITLEQALQLAIANNKILQEAKLNLERSQHELRQAKAAQYPTFDVGLNLSRENSAQSELGLKQGIETFRQEGRTEEEINNIDDETITDSFNGNLNFTYNLYTGGGRGADIRRAKKQVDLNELNLEQIEFETRFETTRDYYSLQNNDSQVEIEEVGVNDAKQTLQDAQLLKQAGISTKFDVLRAKVELADAKQRLATAKSEQSTARRQLIATLDIGQQVELTTADEIEQAGDWEFSLEETIVMAYNNRAELDQFLVSREINEQQRQIALSTIRPQVDLLASYSALEVFDDDINISDGYTVAAQVNWSLFDGGVARAEARQSETDIQINEVQFAEQRNEVRLEVEQGYYALNASQENIQTSIEALEFARESLELARIRFQAGEGTQTDVIQSQSELTTARANYFQSIITYNQSLNQLERAVTNLPKNN